MLTDTHMKLGLGLYRGLLSEDNFKFAKQAGVTHLVVHLVDYFKGKNPELTSGPNSMGWGVTTNQERPWSYDDLMGTKRSIEANGLTWEAIENFDPSHWHDVLLDGPKKAQQMELLERTIQTIGRVGIPIMGYNFSIAGVWARRGEGAGLRRVEDRPAGADPERDGLEHGLRPRRAAGEGAAGVVGGAL